VTSVRKTGDWAVAGRLLAGGPAKLKAAVGTALRQEAQLLRKEIVQGITKQAPGGESIKPPSPLTLAAREMKGRAGTKALMVSGDLRNSVAAIVKGDEAFIGVPRKARRKDGKSLVDVAKVQEFGKGPIIIPMTPAMRRFLFALLRKADQEPNGGSGKGVVVVQIPARPFLRPAFKKFQKGVQKRFLGRVAGLMGFGPRKGGA
jgi:phage gpG-like protein